MLDEFLKYLEAEVENHSIYVIGGQGKRGKEVTETWIRSRETDTANAERAIKTWKKQCEAGYGDRLGAFDCSGLGMYFLQNVKGIFTCDLNANGMKGKCKELPRNQVRKGDWVFMLSGTRATHIGFVADDELNVIEARGRDHGVCKAPLSSRSWQYFGRPEIFREEIESASDRVLLKKGDKGDEVLALQYGLLACGYKLDRYGADGKLGNETLAAVNELQADNGLCKGSNVGDAEATALGFKNGFILKDAAHLLLLELLRICKQKNGLTASLEAIKDILKEADA